MVVVNESNVLTPSNVHKNVLSFEVLRETTGASFSPKATLLDTSKRSRASADDSIIEAYNAGFQSAQRKKLQLEPNTMREQVHRQVNDSTHFSANRKARLRSLVQK